MLFDLPVIDGVLLKRYKRFLADVQLPSGETVVAHVPNSGSMLGVNAPGSACRLLHHQNTSRKLSYTLVQVQAEGKTWVGVDTSLPNRLVAEALQSRRFEFWREFAVHFREVKISDESRIDFVLAPSAVERKQLPEFIAGPHGKGSAFVEIKNVSLSWPPAAVFPD